MEDNGGTAVVATPEAQPRKRRCVRLRFENHKAQRKARQRQRRMGG